MTAHWTKAFRSAVIAGSALLISGNLLADSLSGNLDAGKTVLVMTGTWSGSDAGTTEMKVCTKRAASYSLPDLEGTWGLNSLASGPGAPWWLRGTLTVDAAGHYTLSAVDSEGEPDSGSGAISLLGDGSFAINEVPGGRFRMDAGKTVLAGTSTWADHLAGTTELPILAKRAASYSTADLSGTWQDHTLASGPGGPYWERGTYLFNNGSFTYTYVDSTGDSHSGSGTMAITANGVMSIPGHPEPFQCQMNAGKTVVVCTTTWLTGGSDNGTTALSMSLKKAASYSSADLVGNWDCNSLATGPGEPWWERSSITISANGSFSGSATDSSQETYSINGDIVLNESGFVAPLMPGQFLLTAGASGTGAGTVSSGDGKVFFSYPTNDEGITALDQGATLTLSAVADNLSSASWFGDCSTTGGSAAVATCTITSINAAKNVSALFTRRMVRIAETSAYYTSIQTAYDAATTNQTVQLQATDFSENLILANPNAVSLKGGYNADFSAHPGLTTVTGTVTISGGRVTVENITIL